MSTAAELAAYHHQVHESTIAVWTPTAIAVIFLAVRLYIRHSRLGSWLSDDWLLFLATAALITGCALVSVSFASDISNDDGKRHFFTYHQASSVVLTGATTWSKCAFILTLWGVTNSRGAKLFLVFLMISSHLLLVVSGLGIYAPACGDPKIPLRPYWAGSCLDETAVRSMFLLPIVYGGIMDVVLSLYPWMIVRNLQLQNRERLGVAIAMGLGAITGVIVILRSILQFKKL
ncbi:hypothetical protein E8E14_011972 [Neopestalotiopsis sp. 37M]|nr:hypothetical protein E8E14_011972 [Neopestalotiopsis sp. 37M]